MFDSYTDKQLEEMLKTRQSFCDPCSGLEVFEVDKEDAKALLSDGLGHVNPEIPVILKHMGFESDPTKLVYIVHVNQRPMIVADENNVLWVNTTHEPGVTYEYRHFVEKVFGF